MPFTDTCTSAVTERTFSVHGNIHSVKWNRLTTEKAAKPAYISYKWNMLHNQIDIEVKEEEESISSYLEANPLTISILNLTKLQLSTFESNIREI